MPKPRHQRTRAGCLTCRTRKIKCDQGRPICANCVKHDAECVYDARKRLVHRPKASPQPGSTPGDHASPSNQPYSPALNMPHLELLHYFTTMTYATMSSRDMVRDFFRTTAPRIGLEHDFVMESILAVAALHLSTNRPNKAQHYRDAALLHHGRATQSVAAVLPQANKENADALFLFTMLTMLVALNSTRSGDTHTRNEIDTDKEFPNWVFLMGGTRALIPLIRENLTHSMVAPILAFHRGRTPQHVGVPEIQHPALSQLTLLVNCSVTSQENNQVYTRAILELGKGLHFNDSLQEPSEATDAFIWLFEVGDDFLALLKRQEQEAVAIFAFWCVLLKRVGDVWWVSGWARELVATCWEMLDQVHRLWICWPMEEIGWSPP